MFICEGSLIISAVGDMLRGGSVGREVCVLELVLCQRERVCMCVHM